MIKKIIFVLIILFIIPTNALALTDSAKSSILIDIDSNRILYSKNIHEVRSVASISKIMTAIIAIESNQLKDIITIEESVLKAYGSGIYVKIGEELTLEDLLYGLMLRSGNDAALAIADYVGGDIKTFVAKMNDKAVSIGMKNSTFYNPSGLDEDSMKGNFSTAYDMAILTSYAMHNPIYKKIVSTKKYTLKTNKNTYTWHNKNKLLNTYKNTTGGKTGFTKKARRTLVSTASKNNLSLAAVTLDDGNDFIDHTNMHEYGFNNYQQYILLKKGKITIKDDEFYKHHSLIIKKDFTLALSLDEKDNVKLNYQLNKIRKLKDGNVVGKIEASIDDQILASINIYYQIEKEEKKKSRFFSWIKRLW